MKFIITLLCLGSLLFSTKAEEDFSFALIYYTHKFPEYVYQKYDILVVDPDGFPLNKIKQKYYKNNTKRKILAYVSIGEVEPYREYYKKVRKSWILGDNKGWVSKVADLRKREYQDFLIENVFEKHKEFDGFLLDTLDSYQLVLSSEKERKEYEVAMANFIKKLREKYNDKFIVINRGFEIVDYVKNYINFFIAEGLFYGLDIRDNMDIRYKKMDKEEIQEMLKSLNYVKSFGIKVGVVDYYPPSHKNKQIEIAKRICKAGFIPFVSDKLLSTVGVGLVDTGYKTCPPAQEVLKND